MIETLQHIDASLLVWLNSFHCQFFDTLMYLISDKFVWIPMYAAIVIISTLKYGFKTKLLYVFALFGIAFAMTDFTCASIIRPLVCRPRPSNIDSPLYGIVHIVNGYRGGHYGFPSCHAANSFMLAAMITLFFRNRRLSVFMYSWAFIHSYSRIYLGVHYPGDIIVGAMVGTAVAFIVFYAFKRIGQFRSREHYSYLDYIPYIGLTTFALLILSATYSSFTIHSLLVKF